MKQKTIEDKSRKEARGKMQDLHSELNKDFWRTNYIHHIDKNPLNNDLNNLQIIGRRDHIILHNSKPIKQKICKYKIKDTFKKIQTNYITCIHCGRELFQGKCLCGRDQRTTKKQLKEFWLNFLK